MIHRTSWPSDDDGGGGDAETAADAAESSPSLSAAAVLEPSYANSNASSAQTSGSQRAGIPAPAGPT